MPWEHPPTAPSYHRDFLTTKRLPSNCSQSKPFLPEAALPGISVTARTESNYRVPTMKMLLHRCWPVWLRWQRWQEKLRMLSTEAIASPDSFSCLFCAALGGLELLKIRLPLNSESCGCLCLQNGGIKGVPLQTFPRLAASVGA